MIFLLCDRFSTMQSGCTKIMFAVGSQPHVWTQNYKISDLYSYYILYIYIIYRLKDN